MEKQYFVYKLIDPRNNTPFYIGKGLVRDKQLRKYRRLHDHVNLHDRANLLKTSVIRKITKQGLIVGFEILYEGPSESESFRIEKEFISLYGKRINSTGSLTNITDGGEGISGHVHSSATRLKQSTKRKQWIQNNYVPFKGCTHSAETCRFLSNFQKNRFKTESGTMTGRTHSEETKRIISEKMKLRVTPKEEWYKFGSKGAKNPQAKNYIFIDTNNEKFTVSGEFKKFIKDNNLSLDTCKSFINKGKIPGPINSNHNRLSENRKNTTGWEIIRL